MFPDNITLECYIKSTYQLKLDGSQIGVIIIPAATYEKLKDQMKQVESVIIAERMARPITHYGTLRLLM